MLRFLSFVLSLTILACATSRPPIPVGAVPQVQQVSAADEEYGQQVLDQLTQQFPLDRDDRNILRVRDIVDRLTEAAHADQQPWHVYVLRDDRVKNAAATRGDYVFVWTGMLRAVKSDDELAAIVAHEIGHVLAGHTMPDPSEEVNQMISGVAGAAAREAVGRTSLGPAAGIAEMIISQSINAFIVNPGLQRKEYEADQVGLFLMADAGYDPRAAINFWDRVQGDPDFGSSAFQLLSTHPSSESRLAALSQMLPEAEARFRGEKKPAATVIGQLRKPQQEDSFAREAKDSFARGKYEDFVKGPHGIQLQFFVATDDAPLHAKPTYRSDELQRLKRGQSVTADCSENGWIRVTSPDFGYIDAIELHMGSVTPEDLSSCKGRKS